jgi:tetratricopeptide (TPR) repeat protein
MGLTQALIHLGRYEEAWQIVDPIAAVLAVSDDIRRHARITFLKGRILYALGRYPEAEAALKQAAEGLDARADAALLFDINHTLFWVIWVQGRYDDATQAGWELYLAAESARTDHQCSAKLALTYCHLIAGDPSEAMHLADQAVGHAREIGHPFREADSLMLLGSAEEIVGHYEQATESLQAALALATRLKTVFLQASVSTSLGFVFLALGKISSAIEHFQSASEHAEAIRENRTLAAALAGKARALCLQNQGEDLLRAYVAAEQALKLSQDQALPVEAESRMTLAQVCLAMDKKDHALEHAAVAVKLLDKLGTMERFEIEILLTAHDALEATGRADEARAVLTRAWQTFEEQADRISDAAVRDSFMKNVPHNARLLEFWEGEKDGR